MRTGYLGDLPSGTIEAFVDFKTACITASEYWPIFSAGSEFQSSQWPVLWLGADGYLVFKMRANGKIYIANSRINPCRYLDGNGDKTPYFELYGLPVLWPYETWRFHHVAATWGPRGMEIWVDGVLHGVGLDVADPNNPPSHNSYSCSPQQQEQSASYPYCVSPQQGLVPGAYGGGVPPYSTFLIGCDSMQLCFKGRFDEVHISNIQRTFSPMLNPVPPLTPTPTVPPPNPDPYPDLSLVGLRCRHLVLQR